MIGDVVGKWDDHMINGYPEEAYESDGCGAPMIDPGFAELGPERRCDAV